MTRKWQMREARAKLSELIRATADEPQEITIHGRAAAVVLSKEDFDRLTRPKVSFVQMMRESPLVGVDLKIRRDRSPAREVELKLD